MYLPCLVTVSQINHLMTCISELRTVFGSGISIYMAVSRLLGKEKNPISTVRFTPHGELQIVWFKPYLNLASMTHV